MPYVDIISINDTFDVRPMTDETADHYMQQGGDPIYIEDDVFEAWVAHKKQHAVFNALWRTLQNQHAERATRIYGRRS
jgi:hypothetical protein